MNFKPRQAFNVNRRIIPAQTQGELQEASSLAEERGEELEEIAQQLQQALEGGTASAKVRTTWLACCA